MANLAITEPAEQLARLQQNIDDLLAEAKRRGATAAEAAVSNSTGLEVAVRLGEVRRWNIPATMGFGLRSTSVSARGLQAPRI